MLWLLSLATSVLISCMLLCGALSAVTVNQVNDFQDGTTEGWGSGPGNPNPPGNVPDGGPSGGGDGFLKIVSTGDGGSGSHLNSFNRSEWNGDYIAAGASSITADVNNLGDTALQLRVALKGSNGTWFALQDAVPLEAGSGWTGIVFSLRDGNLIRTSGSGSYTATLSDIREIRINSSTTPGHRGQTIAGTLGVDNITLLGTSFRRGDVTDSREVNLADVIATLEVLFIGKGEITCSDAADSNDDGAVNIGDVIFTLFVLFLEDLEIPDPGPLGCGLDPTEDELPCQSSPDCD